MLVMLYLFQTKSYTYEKQFTGISIYVYKNKKKYVIKVCRMGNHSKWDKDKDIF